ncbi:CHAT domain-containing protein [Halorussus limi]|uniref:CHAT domain-containing protein n=1 Tax=Halorussus limi TaxID=2938695 RepID=A0A8U0HU52_9EURY|nr:CHAT domain-containing protein [Halorussus limi]UPV74301.1 CHAT domain-containing protein [Halorussus limi]
MNPRFDSPDDESGIAVIDPVGSNRVALYTPGSVSPEPADTDGFVYPVSAARRFVTSEIRFRYAVQVSVRRSDGAYLCDLDPVTNREFDDGEYLLEVTGPVKMYLRVPSSISTERTDDGLRFEFGGDVEVELGARLPHNTPAATITVPDAPAAAMDAISTFGSALKTTSPERSWPTLRGHPPRIERGDELAIPDELDAPDTGITIHVPATYEHVLPVAPLAYYLGARVVPGDPPRLTTTDGFTHRLGEGDEFGDEVARLLKRVYVLDCATRGEGFHPVELPARRAVESVADLDFATLYDAPPVERLPTYLSVPETVAEEVKPTWGRVTYARPVAESLELLPYAVYDLSIVRAKAATPDAPATVGANDTTGEDALSSFKRRSDLADLGLPSESGERAAGVPDPDEYVPLPEADALERAWIGDGTPVHGTKLHAAAFRHERTESTDGVIEVTVVCNDEEMREEWDAVSDVYGARDEVPFEVDCRFGVTTDELRTLLAADRDLFHFIGHVDGRGLACSDGLLDAETVDETGATTILLNACRSHDQGVSLVEAGARAAIVSWGDVGNSGAVEVGETFAQLLNYGFAVGSALAIVEEYTSIGRHYVAVGDPSVAVAQCEDGTPSLCEFDSDSDATSHTEGVRVRMTSYPSAEFAVGTVVHSYLRDGEEGLYTVPGSKRFENTVEEMREGFGNDPGPILVDDELRWTDEWFDGE